MTTESVLRTSHVDSFPKQRPGAVRPPASRFVSSSLTSYPALRLSQTHFLHRAVYHSSSISEIASITFSIRLIPVCTTVSRLYYCKKLCKKLCRAFYSKACLYTFSLLLSILDQLLSISPFLFLVSLQKKTYSPRVAPFYTYSCTHKSKCRKELVAPFYTYSCTRLLLSCKCKCRKEVRVQEKVQKGATRGE